MIKRFLIAVIITLCLAVTAHAVMSENSPSIKTYIDAVDREGFQAWADSMSISEINQQVAGLTATERTKLCSLLLDSNAKESDRDALLDTMNTVLTNPDLGFYSHIFSRTTINLEGEGYYYYPGQAKVTLNPNYLTFSSETKRNILMHEAFHSFNDYYSGPEGALNEGSAIWVFKKVFGVQYPMEDFAEATYGTKLGASEPDYPLEAPMEFQDKLIEVYAWLSEDDLSKLPWWDNALLKELYQRYYSTLNRNVDFYNEWLPAVGEATKKMLNDPLMSSANRIPMPFVITGVKSDKSSMLSGEPVTWTVQTTRGGEPLYFQYTLFKDGAKIHVKDYTVSNTFTYIPKEPGKYYMQISVKNSTSVGTRNITSGIVYVFLNQPVISALSVTGTRAQISWSAVSGAVSYYVYRSVNGGAFTFLKGTTGTTIIDNDLVEGSQVSYALRANAGNGTVSEMSKAKGIRILTAPIINSLGVNGTTATLKWGAVSGAVSYYVFRSVDSSAYMFLKGTTGTTINDPGLTVGSSYYYKVRANESKYNVSDQSALRGIRIVSVLPDLSPTKITSNTDVIYAGDSVVLDSGIMNTGSTPTEVFNLKWFINDIESEYSSHTGIPANTTVMDGNSQIDWQPTNAGEYIVGFFIDCDNHITEENEDNNWAFRTFTVLNPISITSPAISSLSTNGTTMATLVWGAVPYAESYYIYRSVNGGSFTFLKGITDTTITDSGLVPGNSYAYRLQANGAGGTKSEMSAVRSFTLKPAKPVISSLSAKGTTATLRWGAVAGAESYYVYRSVNGGASAFLKGTTGTQVTDNGLTGGSWTSYCVRANAASGAVSPMSSAKGFTVLAAPVIRSLGANGTTATLKWGAVSGAASYYVYRSVNGGAYAFLKGTASTTVNDPGLTVGSSYYYKVRANGSSGNESALSALKGIKISINLAAPVISSLNVSGTTATLSWGKVTYAESYYVYRSVNGGAFAFLKGTTGTTVNNSGLAAGNSYAYRVQANGSGGIKSEKSAVRSFTLKLATPVISSLNTNGTTTATLIWGAVSGAESYYVYRTVNGGTFDFLKGTKGTTVKDLGLILGNSYAYRVQANGPGGTKSDMSAVKSFALK